MGTGETVDGPAVGSSVLAEDGVLLLESKLRGMRDQSKLRARERARLTQGSWALAASIVFLAWYRWLCLLGVPSLSSRKRKSEQSLRGQRDTRRLTGLGNDENVVASTEGILEVGGGSQVDVGIGSVGLAGGGTVKVPLLELAEGGDGAGERLGRAENLSQTIKHFRRFEGRKRVRSSWSAILRGRRSRCIPP